MLSLSYLRTQSDNSFSKAELYKNVGWKSGIKAPASTVINKSGDLEPSKNWIGWIVFKSQNVNVFDILSTDDRWNSFWYI